MKQNDTNATGGSIKKWIVVLIIALVIAFVVALCRGNVSGGMPPAEVEAELMAECNAALADAQSEEFQHWKSEVEKLHGTVTVTSLQCTSCSIKLREGKEEVTDFNTDVESFSMIFVATWDEWIDKGGTTAIQYDQNLITNVQHCSVLDSTALITVTEESIKGFVKGFIQGFVQTSILCL